MISVRLGIAASQRRGDDDDLYSRAEPCRQRRQESGGRTLNRVDSGLYGTRYTLLGCYSWGFEGLKDVLDVLGRPSRHFCFWILACAPDREPKT